MKNNYYIFNLLNLYAMKINTTLEQQQRAVLHVTDTAKEYRNLLEWYHNRLLNVYKELNTFTYPKANEWNTSFKVNKMFEVSNKILPRIISRNPKWIVSAKPDFVAGQDNVDMWALQMQTDAIQDLLWTIFDKYHLTEPVRLWAKSMINYGASFAKVVTKYEISRKIEKVDEEETYIDENGEEQVRKIDKKIREKVSNQYTTIEPKSWTDILYDPRYPMFRDMPAVIEVIDNVRLADLKRDKDNINIDKLEDLSKIKKSQWNYKEQLQAITGLSIEDAPEVDKNNLKLEIYYGLYDLKDDWDERLYKLGVVNGLICVSYEEITQIPFEQIRCFEDTETNLATGFLEPIIWLQRELNYKKNKASEYINHALNRSRVWSPNSWINPKKLISKPNNIIPTSKSVDEAMKNLQEIPHRQLDASYFQEQNDFERQIQWLTFTIDTNNSQNQQGLTNTATGMRIKFFESNAVIDEVRKHLEQWLERLAYKLLQEIAENTEENLTIKQLDDEWFWNINKEAIIDAMDKYEIKIEAWTSSYDTLENRRDDAIAKRNIGQQAMQAQLPVNSEELFKDVLNTFEGTNAGKYIQKPQWLPGGMESLVWWQPWWEIQPPEQQPTWAAAITEQVAKGWVTQWL